MVTVCPDAKGFSSEVDELTTAEGGKATAALALNGEGRGAAMTSSGLAGWARGAADWVLNALSIRV